jgi:GNAT superfamily N-acetyltransferase
MRGLLHTRRVLADIEYRWRFSISDDEVYALTRSYGGNADAGWWDRVRPHILGWATAHLADGTAVAFVNVAWDGGDHAFLLDTKTRLDLQRRGIATNLIRLAAHHAKLAGCEWLHVDFDDAPRLAGFYFDACGFRPTTAGLIHLPDLPGDDAPRGE